MIQKRPRLLGFLTHVLEAQLTIIQAPAGYGKTILLSQWEDALRRDGVRVGLAKLPALGSLRSALDAAKGKAAAGRATARGRTHHPTIILLDEADIRDGADSGDLAALLRCLPEDLHLVLAARRRPALPLGRLRAEGRLFEMGVEELRLTDDEARDLHLQLSGVMLAPPEIATLQERTLGWPLAARLEALHALHVRDATERPFRPVLTGEHGVLFDFLAEEVFAEQPAKVQSFLLRISVLNRICAELCDVVTGRPCSQAMLDHLVRDGLFLLPQDLQRRWYRLHPLFLEFLQRVQQDEDPALAARLARQAAAWFQLRGLDHEAGQHALRSGDLDGACRLLEQVCRNTLGELNRIADMVIPLPRTLLLRFPDLLLSACWVLCNRWQFHAAGQLLDLVEERIREMRRGDAAMREEALRLERLLCHRRMMLALFEDKPALTAERCARLLPDLHLLHPYVRASIHTALLYAEREQFRLTSFAARDEAARRECGLAERSQGLLWHGIFAAPARFAAGDPEGAAEMLRESAELARMQGDPRWLSAIPSLMLAEIHLERDELDAAQALVDAAMPELRHGTVDHLIAAYGTCAQLHWLAGRQDAAFAAMDEGLRLAARHGFHRLKHAMVGLRVRCLAVAGAGAAALHFAEQSGISLRGEPPNPRRGTTGEAEQQAMAWARVALLSGDAARVLQVAGRWAEFTAGAGAIRSAIRWGILAARMEAAQDNERLAQRRLRRALMLAAPGRYIRSFLDEGSVVAELLRRQLAAAPLAETAADRFLQTLLRQRPAAAALAPDPVLGRAGGFTRLEAEIALLASAGLRNREIGERLGLTEGSVKWYMQRIYDKTGIRRRASVAERARAAGLMA